MKKSFVMLFGALALAATGCSGEFVPEGGNGPGDNTPAAVDAGDTGEEPQPEDGITTAKALFEANVYDVLNATCNPGGACHAGTDPAFVGAQQSGSYDKIMPYKDRLFPGNLDTGKIISNGQGGAHYGAQYDQADLDTIRAWLAQEKIEADAGGGAGPSALAVWSGCMDLGDWDNEGVAGAWSNKEAQGQGNCEACHNLGADGFMASDQSARVFKYITEDPAFMPSYFTLDATGTNVVINRARLEKVGNQLPPHENHGAFDVDGNAMEALQRFYDKTKARLDAGQCGPPRFPTI